MHNTDSYLVHRWLHDHAGILHRDLGPNNIMYRKVKGKIHGVLADYDLASLRSSLTLDRTKTSQQRTGTPPFMAHGLLKGNDPIHLYRHDLESLFYTMLILATHYEIRAPGEDGGGMQIMEGELHFQDWFETTNYNSLARMKFSFLGDMLETFKPSPSLKGFRGWLSKLRIMFHRGFTAKNAHKLLQVNKEQSDDDEESDDEESNHKESNHKESDDEESDDEESDDGDSDDEVTPCHYDDETLGGHVTYSAFIKTARKLSGKLRGLVIRYDPPQAPPSIRIGTAGYSSSPHLSLTPLYSN